jgi:hypothetical protein
MLKLSIGLVVRQVEGEDVEDRRLLDIAEIGRRVEEAERDALHRHAVDHRRADLRLLGQVRVASSRM